MREEYEVISHNNANFHLFLVKIFYRSPHIHRDYEICLIMDGEVCLITQDKSVSLQKNDIFIINPFESHEIKAGSPALILSLQVSPSFFAAFYPQIKYIYLDRTHLCSADSPSECRYIHNYVIELAYSFFKREPLYELKCASLVNQLFFYILRHLPFHEISDKERISSKTRGKRMQNITQYIDEHYSEKLLLSDIAEREDMDLYYLSHFFKDNFGMSFQNYLLKIRCERARRLLLLTDYSLLDISVSCGFSDPKYFNKGFQQQYGYTPKEYRKNFQKEDFPIQQNHLLSTQEFLSDSSSLITLDRYYT